MDYCKDKNILVFQTNTNGKFPNHNFKLKPKSKAKNLSGKIPKAIIKDKNCDSPSDSNESGSDSEDSKSSFFDYDQDSDRQNDRYQSDISDSDSESVSDNSESDEDLGSQSPESSETDNYEIRYYNTDSSSYSVSLKYDSYNANSLNDNDAVLRSHLNQTSDHEKQCTSIQTNDNQNHDQCATNTNSHSNYSLIINLMHWYKDQRCMKLKITLVLFVGSLFYFTRGYWLSFGSSESRTQQGQRSQNNHTTHKLPQTNLNSTSDSRASFVQLDFSKLSNLISEADKVFKQQGQPTSANTMNILNGCSQEQFDLIIEDNNKRLQKAKQLGVQGLIDEFQEKKGFLEQIYVERFGEKYQEAEAKTKSKNKDLESSEPVVKKESDDDNQSTSTVSITAPGNFGSDSEIFEGANSNLIKSEAKTEDNADGGAGKDKHGVDNDTEKKTSNCPGCGR